MVAKAKSLAWRRHELATKAIFEALLKQDNAQELEIKHNETIKGRVTTHQIDVSWKFRMGPKTYAGIVEVKRQNGRAKKGDLLRFHCVLMDIPGRPKGVFVAHSGYQRGALEVAKAADITLYQIKEMRPNEPEDPNKTTGYSPKDPIKITGYSTFVISQNPDKIAWEYSIFIPTLGAPRMTFDSTWAAENPGSMPAKLGSSVVLNFHKVHFVDDAGNVSSSLASMIQDTIRTFGRTGLTELKIDFQEPTYVVGLTLLNRDGDPVGKVKILRFSVSLAVAMTTMTRPHFSGTAATYLFKSAMEEDGRYVLVAENGGEMAAQLSVPRATLRIG